MKNLYLRLAISFTALLLMININAAEVQIFHTDFSDLQALTNANTPATVSTDGKFQIIKGSTTPSGAAVSWAANATSYFLTSSSAGQITFNNLVLNNGGRIVIKWGSTSSRALNVASGTAIGTNIGTHPALASADRSTIVTDNFTIPSSITGNTSITLGSSGGGGVYIFDVTVYTTPAGPVINNFTLAGVAGTIDVTSGAIAVTVPYATNLSSLVPTFVLAGGTSFVTPADQTAAKNFNAPVTYNMTDGSTTKIYTVTVTKTPASTAKSITAFSLLGVTGTIDETAKTISVVVPFSSNLAVAQIPTVSVSPLATLVTTGGQIFTAGVPKTYTVQAEDGSTQDYAVTVTKATASSACNITSFTFGLSPETITIDNTTNTITVGVGPTVNKTALTATITTSPLSTLTAAVPTDFSSPVTITVKAEDGTTKTYTVTVSADTTPPAIVSIYPAINSSIANAAGNITLNFAEKVVLGSGTITLTDMTTGIPVTLTPNAISGTGSISVTIPYSGLVDGDTYTFDYPAGTFVDMFGNPSLPQNFTYTKVSTTSCPAGTIPVTLFHEDFGTYPDETTRTTSTSIINIPYDGSGDVSDGNYAIVSNPNNSSSWAVNGYDHTSQITPYPTGTYGGMLFFNAGNTAGIVFYSKEVGVCSGTNLEFSAWYANAHRSNATDPNITFNIYGKNPDGTYTKLDDGSATASPTESSTGAPEWYQLTYPFNSAAYSTVKVEITNNVNATNGNDILIDDIQFKACLPLVSLSQSGTSSSNVTVSDSTITHITVAAAASASTLYPTTYYLLQSSSDGVSWNSIGVPDITIAPVDITGFCDRTYLRLIVAGDAATCISATTDTPSGCYTISQSMTITKTCALPTISPISADNPTPCPGEAVTLSTSWTSGGYGDITNWKWESSTDGGTTWTTLTSPPFNKGKSILTVNPTVKTMYRVSTENKICASSSLCTSPPQTITIDFKVCVAPIISPISADNQTPCPGAPVTLSTFWASGGYGDITNWKWESSTDGGTTWITLTSPAFDKLKSILTVNPTVKTIYRVSSENKICPLSAPCTSIPQTITIDMVAPITNSLVVDKPKVCEGTEITLTASESGPVTSSNWQYSTNGGSTWNPIGGASGLIQKETPNTTTWYQYISNGACTPTAHESNVVQVQVNPTFDVEITLTSPNFLAANLLPITGGNVTVSAITTAVDPTGFKYTWTPLSSINASFTETVTKNTTYSVLVNDKDNLCSATATSDSILLGSITLTTLLYPNGSLNKTFGTNDMVTGEPLTTNLGDYSLVIFNRYGQKISDTKNTGWDGTYKGKVADAGVYFYVLQYKDASGKSVEKKGSVEVVK